MSATETPAAEPSLADYIKAENAKEQAEDRGEVLDVVSDAKPVDAASPVEVKTEPEPTEPVEAKADDRNPDGTFKPKSKKVTNTGEWARNQRLTAELRQAQEELTRLRSAPQPASTPAPVQLPQVLDPNDPEPTLERFLDRPDPYAALAVEAGKWAVREERRQMQQQQAITSRQEAQQQTIEREQAFAQSHPDYYEQINPIVELLKVRPAVLAAIADDDLGPAVAYHLAQHPEEAQRISLMTPLEGVKAIGSLLSRVTPASVGSGPLAVSTSKAKPLIKPVSGSPVAPESSPPDQQPFGKKYIMEMNAKERREREAMRGA